MSNSKANVSVIVPNHNYGHFLRDSLTSVISQTYQDWEIIVVDNFSSDDSESVVRQLQEPRVSFVKFDNGGSIAKARNFGASIASGTFIAFLDADDRWHARKLERQVRIMESGEDLTYHSVRRFGRRGGVIRSWRLSRSNPLEHLISGGNPIVTSSAIIRAEILSRLGGFPENKEIISAEDYALWLRVAADGFRIEKCNGVLGMYRVHASTSSRVDAPKAAELAVHPFLKAVSPRIRVKSKGFISYARGVRFEALGEIKQARSSYLECLKYASFRFAWRAMARLLSSIILF